MQIEKDIAAILQNRLKASGKTKQKFSEELGIPRSTLQGYLKGNAGLRSDSIEELAKCLGLTPAQLISGPEYVQADSEFCLESLSAEIQSLHPQAQTLAKEAVSLLNAAFRISAEFDRLDRLPDTTQQHDPTRSFDGHHEFADENMREL